MPFEKGNKLGGRKKKTEAQILFEQRCREYLSTKGWNRIRDMADSREISDVKYALDKILNHGIGKPTESVDVTTFEGEDTRSDKEIMEDAKKAYEQLREAESQSNGTRTEKA